MNNELISVVVPIYNVEKYLKRCISSILNQTYKSLEIILVDDGSPDNCGEICDYYSKIDNRVCVIHQKNKGLSEARNRGIKEATGKYIMFIDSDDYIEENMIEVLYTNLLKYNADISSCGHNDIYDEKNKRRKEIDEKKLILTSQDALQVFLFTTIVDVVAWNKLYKIELFNNIKYEVGKLFEDHLTTYKLIDVANKVVYTNLPLYNYCKRNNSIGGSEFSKKNYQLKDALDIECEYIKKKYPSISKEIDLGYILWLIVLYDKIILSDRKDLDLENIIRTYIRNNLGYILKFNNTSVSKKIQLLLLGFCPKVYKIIYKTYLKINR